MPTAPRLVAFRSISSTPNYQKGPVDAAKDTLKKADEVASKAALKGIDQGGLFHPSRQLAAHSVGLEGNAN